MVDAYKMLLVDDDPNDIELIQLAIQDLSFIQTLDILTDGEQAINYLLNQAGPTSVSLPRFILMDLKLPKLTGIEVLRTIRGDPLTRCLPVVIMSSSSEETDLQACYVVKPLGFYEFQRVVREVTTYWMTINHPRVV